MKATHASVVSVHIEHAHCFPTYIPSTGPSLTPSTGSARGTFSLVQAPQAQDIVFLQATVHPQYTSHLRGQQRSAIPKPFPFSRAVQRPKMISRLRRMPAAKRGLAPRPDHVEDKRSSVHHKHQLWSQRTVSMGIFHMFNPGTIQGNPSKRRNSQEFPEKIPRTSRGNPRNKFSRFWRQVGQEPRLPKLQIQKKL